MLYVSCWTGPYEKSFILRVVESWITRRSWIAKKSNLNTCLERTLRWVWKGTILEVMTFERFSFSMFLQLLNFSEIFQIRIKQRIDYFIRKTQISLFFSSSTFMRGSREYWAFVFLVNFPFSQRSHQLASSFRIGHWLPSTIIIVFFFGGAAQSKWELNQNVGARGGPLARPPGSSTREKVGKESRDEPWRRKILERTWRSIQAENWEVKRDEKGGSRGSLLSCSHLLIETGKASYYLWAYLVRLSSYSREAIWRRKIWKTLGAALRPDEWGNQRVCRFFCLTRITPWLHRLYVYPSYLYITLGLRVLFLLHCQQFFLPME